MGCVVFIVSWLLLALLPAVLLGVIPLVGWILGLAWFILATYAILQNK